MTTKTRIAILRANALYLFIASLGGLRTDLMGSFFCKGPLSGVIQSAPHAGIGFVEAHGLAFILSILLWRAAPLRSWHLTAAAIHTLLGTANVAFWQLFVATDLLWLGYLTTALHWVFVLLEIGAAMSERASRPAEEGQPFPPDRIGDVCAKATSN